MANTPLPPAGAGAAAVSPVTGCGCVCVMSTVGWSPAERVRCTALDQLFTALHTARPNKLVESLQIWNPINTNTMAAQQVVQTLSAINLQSMQLYFLILYVVSVLSCLHSDVGMQVMIIFIFYECYGDR